MDIFDRSKVSLSEKKKNFIPDKDEFKLAKSSKQTNGTLSSPRQQRPN